MTPTPSPVAPAEARVFEQIGCVCVPGESLCEHHAILAPEAYAELARLTAERDRLAQEVAALRHAAGPFIVALNEQERRWAKQAWPEEDPHLPDYLELNPLRLDLTPTVADARALRRALTPATPEAG